MYQDHKEKMVNKESLALLVQKDHKVRQAYLELLEELARLDRQEIKVRQARRVLQDLRDQKDLKGI